MELHVRLGIVALLTVCLGGCAGMGAREDLSNRELGVKLVWEMWQDIEDGNVQALEKTMAPGFQSLHQFGAGGREETLQIVRKLKMGSYTLDTFKVTRSGPVLVVTYTVAVEETIRGARLPKKTTPRMTIFVRGDDGRWRWLAHANPRTVLAGEEDAP